MGFYATNGKSIKALDIDNVLGAGFESSLATRYDFTPRMYYTLVPFIRRAVRLRANAVAGVPVTLQRGSRDLSSRPEFEALMGGIKNLIWRTEFALCLSTYGAYWRRTSNATGLNPTPEWLLPQSCWPYITAESGLEYIRYIRPWGVPNAGSVEQLPLDDVVYFWYPSLDRAMWPGSPPGQTALAAASALTNRDTFVANYFRRGAVKDLLLQVPQSTSEDNRNRLRDWWRQTVAGIMNAFRANVISADVKPIVIGDGLKDTESDALTLQYRQDVAAAFDVPESMLLANAANYATAREERISFYEETVFPELALILDAVNTQWLQDAYDADLCAHPEQTEAKQDAQVQQAQAITELVGKPVLTVNEGRAWLGMEPMEEQEPAAPDEAADYQAMEGDEEADDLAEQGAEQGKGSSSDPGRMTDAERITDAERMRDAERMKPPSKALATSAQLARAGERMNLRMAHRTAREATLARHQEERKVLRSRHIEERQGAIDASTRLRLIQRHNAEMAVVARRQAAERGMLRSLHAAERGRLRDRHATQRAFEERRNGHAVEALI